MIVERFAPSPSGALHLGHAFSAWTGWRQARASGGSFLLRIEDLDAGRSREAHVAAILADLAWFGLDWDGPVLRQSARRAAYAAAIGRLAVAGLVYVCTCTRRDIAEAARAPQEGAAPVHGPDGLVYPGTCRPRRGPAPTSPAAGGGGAVPEGAALRLDIARAIAALGGAERLAGLGFTELDAGPAGECGRIALDARALVAGTGDIVLRRRDGAPAYHLAVVVDDAWQGVSHVTRGRDLFAATPVQRLLQALLGLPEPVYRHHRLIRDAAGRRLAKRDDATSLASLREAGETPGSLKRRLGIADA